MATLYETVHPAHLEMARRNSHKYLDTIPLTLFYIPDKYLGEALGNAW